MANTSIKQLFSFIVMIIDAIAFITDAIGQNKLFMNCEMDDALGMSSGNLIFEEDID